MTNNLISVSGLVDPCFQLFFHLAVISGKDIHPQHCVIHCSDEDIFVQPLQGICFINRMKIETSTKLSQGTDFTV